VKYFTQAWASGDVPEGEDSLAFANYARDLSAAFDADSNIRRFVENVGLNDAYIDRVTFDPKAASLDLLLLTGSVQVGYWHSRLTYRGVSQITGQSILREALAARPTEVWYDEFRREAGSICHAFLLTPRGTAIESAGEFAIWFQSFDYSQTPASDRRLMSSDDRSDWRSP